MLSAASSMFDSSHAYDASTTRFELVVNAALTKRLDALTRNVERSGSVRCGPLIGNIRVNVNAAGANLRNLPRKIAKELAYEITQILGDDMRVPAGGAVISDGGFSSGNSLGARATTR